MAHTRLTVNAIPAVIRVRCDACGQRGEFSREVHSDPVLATAEWAVPHLSPVVTAVKVVTEQGLDIGWFTPT